MQRDTAREAASVVLQEVQINDEILHGIYEHCEDTLAGDVGDYTPHESYEDLCSSAKAAEILDIYKRMSHLLNKYTVVNPFTDE